MERCTKSENQIHAHKTGLNKSNLIPKLGEANGNSKLNWESVRDIRNKFKSGASRVELAKEYGISTTTISSINTYKTWIKDNL